MNYFGDVFQWPQREPLCATTDLMLARPGSTEEGQEALCHKYETAASLRLYIEYLLSAQKRSVAWLRRTAGLPDLPLSAICFDIDFTTATRICRALGIRVDNLFQA